MSATHTAHYSAGGLPLESIEHASTDELRALQLTRLRAQLKLAWESVPHYRAKFDAAGVHPNDLRSLADLARFPFTTKDDLRGNYPFGMFAVPRDKVVRIHASSGTTGKPTVVGYTATDIDTWAQLVARSIRAGGARAGDIVHVSYGYGLFTGGLGAHYGAEKLGLTVVPFGGGQTERQVQLIQDFGASIIMVTPSYMLAIADEFERQGINPSESSLRIGIFGAEPWTNEMRAEIERRLKIDAVDIYGLSEVRARAWLASALKRRTARRSGRITSIPRSSIRTPVSRCPMESSASWCLPRLPRKRFPSSGIARATSRDSCLAPRAPCAACRKSPAGRMT